MAEPSAGEGLKATQSGQFPTGTVRDILEKAPSDIIEEVIDIPEWECSVKVRSLTAQQASRLKQVGFAIRGERTDVAWAEMEVQQFQMTVVEPKFSLEDVKKLHAKSGRGFARVIDWADEKSGLNKEELRKARKEFPEDEQ